MEITAFRMVAGCVAVCLLTWACGRRVLPARQDILPAAICGVIGMASYNLALAIGQQHITAAESSLLVSLAPVFTVLAAHFFLRESIGGRTWFGVAVAFCGVAVMELAGQEGFHINLWSLASIYAAATQTVLTLVQREMVRQRSALEITCFSLQFAALASLPFGWTVFPVALSQPLSEPTLLMLYLAVGPLALGYIGWAFVLRHIDVATASAACYFIPVFALALGYYWLGEIPGVTALLGGAMVLLGVALTKSRSRPAPVVA